MREEEVGGGGGRDGGWRGDEGKDCLDLWMMRPCYSRESVLALVVRYAVISGEINLAEERRGNRLVPPGDLPLGANRGLIETAKLLCTGLRHDMPG